MNKYTVLASQFVLITIGIMCFNFAYASCDTPLQCYEKALTELENTKKDLKSRITQIEELKNELTEMKLDIDALQRAEGARGPEWRPTIHIDNLSNPKSSVQNMTKSLGTHAFCALSRAGTSHVTNACVCTVSGNANSLWKLTLQVDESVKNTRCNCGAVCISP